MELVRNIAIGNSLYTLRTNFLKDLLLYFWLHWAFVAAHGLSLVVVSGGYSLSQGMDLVVRSSRVLERRLSSCGPCGLSCPAAYRIFPEQGSNSCSPHGQVDS